MVFEFDHELTKRLIWNMKLTTCGEIFYTNILFIVSQKVKLDNLLGMEGIQKHIELRKPMPTTMFNRAEGRGKRKELSPFRW